MKYLTNLCNYILSFRKNSGAVAAIAILMNQLQKIKMLAVMVSIASVSLIFNALTSVAERICYDKLKVAEHTADVATKRNAQQELQVCSIPKSPTWVLNCLEGGLCQAFASKLSSEMMPHIVR